MTGTRDARLFYGYLEGYYSDPHHNYTALAADFKTPAGRQRFFLFFLGRSAEVNNEKILNTGAWCLEV
jgi:hypothetical protein